MSDWQKVRVAFQDAIGKEVSAVMWTDGGQFAQSDPDVSRLWIGWNRASAPKVAPIRELPTGLGAVVEIPGASGDVERYVYLGNEWWTTGGGYDLSNNMMSKENFTILSEGIEP